MLNIKNFVFNYIQVNTYLIWDDTLHAAIIDAGCMDDSERRQLTEFIDQQKLVPELLLNTHLHFDHCIGNHYLVNRYHLEPMAHQADAFFPLHQREQLENFGYQNIITEPSYPVSRFFNDGDILRFGNTTMRVIHTPGHSPGSVCFYIEAEKVLFSGDTLFRMSVGRTDFEQGSLSDLMTSLAKLTLLPDATKVYPGHGPATVLRTEKYANPYMQHL